MQYRFSLSKATTLTLGTMGAAILLIIGLVAVPAIRHILDLRMSIEETKASLQNDYDKTQQLRRSIKDLKKVAEEVKQYEKSIISVGKELDIITELENIASSHDIKQEINVSLVDPKQNGKSSQGGSKNLREPHYLITFTSDGTTEQLLRYLQAIEALPYYVTIDRMDWTTSDSAKKASSVVRLKFTGYILLTDPNNIPIIATSTILSSVTL